MSSYELVQLQSEDYYNALRGRDANAQRQRIIDLLETLSKFGGTNG
jgi:hypothetical protein